MARFDKILGVSTLATVEEKLKSGETEVVISYFEKSFAALLKEFKKNPSVVFEESYWKELSQRLSGVKEELKKSFPKGRTKTQEHGMDVLTQNIIFVDKLGQIVKRSRSGNIDTETKERLREVLVNFGKVVDDEVETLEQSIEEVRRMPGFVDRKLVYDTTESLENLVECLKKLKENREMPRDTAFTKIMSTTKKALQHIPRGGEKISGAAERFLNGIGGFFIEDDRLEFILMQATIGATMLSIAAYTTANPNYVFVRHGVPTILALGVHPYVSLVGFITFIAAALASWGISSYVRKHVHV